MCVSACRSLNLNNNNFLGTLPPQLGQLASLSALALADNAFEGSIPPELGPVFPSFFCVFQ